VDWRESRSDCWPRPVKNFCSGCSLFPFCRNSRSQMFWQ
jgi:hypothetical protein